jgi:S-formylglutathione hydrolase FrmB
MLRLVAVALLIASASLPAEAQLFNWVNLDRLNRRLDGRVVDYTANHGRDRQIFSPILGMKRDLYVYLPPGYDPKLAYPMVLYLHTAQIDEHTLIGPGIIETLDAMIARGEFPPTIIAGPDGTYEGENRIKSHHSLYVNGRDGRFEDHLVQEVTPFLLRTYSIRPEREAHAILGTSAGGYGGMGLALKHRDLFGAIATLGGPLNMRYDNTEGRYLDDFDPATYRWKTYYDPNEIAASYYCGLTHSRAKKYIEAVYGRGPEVIARLASDNPADLLFTTDLQPGELAIYVNYPGRDNWNFDAQDQSFAWLAAQKGVEVTLVKVPKAQHSLRYFKSQQRPAYEWLARHLLPPVPRG